MSLTATHVGVVIKRRANEYTCNRCGIIRKINTRRRNNDGTYDSPDRRTYKCIDCLHVEALIQREEQQCDESSGSP